MNASLLKAQALYDFSDRKDLTVNQKVALLAIQREVGGCDNQINDCGPDSADYGTRDNFAEGIYFSVLDECPKEAKFAGRKWIIDTILREIKDCGYLDAYFRAKEVPVS
ncbi:MAG: hypothetical protein LBJ20_01730 [Candidatus Methanoplasma sp.]|jgi:hypothetical protein|nr:hypothetical protein [Candidatus Methanoplasma sp.]